MRMRRKHVTQNTSWSWSRSWFSDRKVSIVRHGVVSSFCCRLLLAWKRTKNDKNIGRGHLLYVTLKSCSKNTLSIGRKHRKLTSRPSVLWRRQIAVTNVVDFGTKPVSSFRSMRSRHVTKSNGVVEQKSSFRKLPNNYTMRRFVAYKSKTHRRGNLLTIHKRYFRLLQSSMNKVLKVLT